MAGMASSAFGSFPPDAAAAFLGRAGRRVRQAGGAVTSALECAVDLQKPLAVVRLRGRLTGENVRRLGGQLAELMRNGHRYLVIELGELGELAPVCVGVLNRTVSELRQIDGSLTLRGLNAEGSQMLKRAGLHPSILLSATGASDNSSRAGGPAA
jgi:anti-anti-sigma regulatory factor